jgi:hypothetical protein
MIFMVGNGGSDTTTDQVDKFVLSSLFFALLSTLE